MEITLYNIRAVAGGAEAELTIEVRGADVQQIKGTVSAEMLAELGLPSTLAEPLALDRARCDEILFFMQKTAAIKKGIDLLGFAQNTARTLRDKLKRRGFSAEIAEEAVAYLDAHGFIQEKNDAAMLASTLAERKLYGKNRIKKELFAKGFPQDVIRETLDEIDVDFGEICARRIASLGGLSLFESREKKAKTVAALMRYGFSYDDIREALERLRDGEV